MKKPRPAQPPEAKTLTEQKTDFTAEGAPPPGHVATDVPATTDDAARPARKRGATKPSGPAGK